MGSNLTRQKRRAEFMKLSLPELASWHLMVTCGGCRDPRYLPVDVLIERYGPQYTLGNIVPRLQCRFRTCRQAPASVRLCSSLEERDPKTVMVMLVGPGAY